MSVQNAVATCVYFGYSLCTTRRHIWWRIAI